MKICNSATALAAVLALGTSAAFAGPITLTGTYSITEQYSNLHGGPTVTDVLHKPLSISLTVGTETTPKSFFTLSPSGSCSGGGCSGGSRGTLTDVLTVDFSNLKISGVGNISPLSDTGTFTAKYSGSELSCAVGDGVSPGTGATDCFDWTGAGSSYKGSTMLSENLGDGYDLDIFLYNKTDWNVTPEVGFELVDAPPTVPEPATLALFAAGLAVLGWGVSRRRQRAELLN